MKKQVSAKLQKISDGILAMAGIFSSPTPGTQPAGNAKSGSAIFIKPEIARSDDINAGAMLIHALAMFVTPFHVLGKKEMEAMKSLIEAATSPKLMQVLDRAHANRQGETFAATLIKATGAPTSHALAVLTALKLYDHWGVISVAQKSLAIAAMGIQLHKTDKNGAICDLVIVEGKNQKFQVKDALDMVQAGKNPYTLVRNWTQIYNLCRVYNDKPSTEALEDFASSHGLLGRGVTDSAVPGITKKGIEQHGGKPAPQYGIGAVAAPRGTKPPQGYQQVASTEGGDIIVPQANLKSAAGALQGSLLNTKAGANGSSSDAAAAYAKWPKKPQIDKGADGGSAFVAGLTALKKTSPTLYGALISFLAKYSHDSIDTQNPIKYISALAGIALARIVAGKAESKADKEGAQITQSIKTNGTPGDYAKLQVDLRGLYASFGVSSRSDAYQLSNQAYAEDRINESDLVAMHEIYDIIYIDNSLEMARKLLVGKEEGLKIIRENVPDATNSMTHGEIHNQGLELKAKTKEEIRKRNAIKFAQKQAESPEEEASEGPQHEAAESPEEETSEHTPSNGGEGSSFDNAQATGQASDQTGATP